MLTMPTSNRRQSLIVLVVVLVAAYAINLDTTIVNVALPTLNLRLGAGTSSLQWVVDGYNLAFAALVLAGGNIGDRYGRRETLSVGLGGFAVASLLAALCTGVGELIAARFAMGAAAALIYPTTLSIITNTFSERKARAAAIGAWGAVSGIGVATGPIIGGVLLEHFWWGSVFVALIPVAVAALAGAWLFVPRSRLDGLAPLDRTGLGLSIIALGALIYTIIEAPDNGWAARSIAGFVAAAAVIALFVRWERSRTAPMLDVRLFNNLRFSAASASVTVAFFSLFGFIFLITQYFQQLRGYGPLSTGVRILPVAFSIAISSVVGSKLVVRIGNKAVAAGGLVSLGASFLWIGLSASLVSYDLIAAQMVLMGTGLGLTSTAATESIMGVVRPEQAGAGSAVNDATREIGGTLGVAVLGSVYSSLYTSHLRGHSGGLPSALVQKATSSFGAGRAVAAHISGAPGIAFGHAVSASFIDGLHAACFVASVICVLGAAFVAGLLPSRPGLPPAVVSEPSPSAAPEAVPSPAVA